MLFRKKDTRFIAFFIFLNSGRKSEIPGGDRIVSCTSLGNLFKFFYLNSCTGSPGSFDKYKYFFELRLYQQMTSFIEFFFVLV